MHNADISNGRRGHHQQDDSAAQILSAEQAAPLLGCTVRHVRRLIARGDLAGHKDPYRTWRSALDAYRHRRQPHEGDVVFTEQHGADREVSATGQEQTGALAREAEDDQSTAVMVAIAAELASSRDQIERLARENGHLRAQLEQARAGQSGPAMPQRETLARLGRWLLR